MAEVQISKGTIITSEMLGMKSPADGLPVNMIDVVIGKRASRDIQPDQAINLDMIEEQ